jgi:menaquinol-cytochrome c reductase iron-sulfur subunit
MTDTPKEQHAAYQPSSEKPLTEDEVAANKSTDELEQVLESSSSLLTRRTLLSVVSIAAGGLASALVGLPLIGFLLAPLVRKQPPVWREVGKLDSFPVGQTQKVTFEDSSSIPWGGSDSETAAWLRRVDDKTFTAFAVDCTHLGCPVRWEADAQLFMCPCHGGVYYQDGEVAAGPPPHALQQFPVRILNNSVQVEWRKLPIVAGNCPRGKREVEA